MIASNLKVIDNPDTGFMAIINRYKTQSISVNDEELEAIKRLAESKRMKPAALARELFYRGLSDFLSDGNIHAVETDGEIFENLLRYLGGLKNGVSSDGPPNLRIPIEETEDENRKIIKNKKRGG